jgi:hypothetical protein
MDNQTINLSLREEQNNDAIRALIGAFVLVSSVVLYWFCAYKCAVCLDEKEKRNRIEIIQQNDDII